MHPALLPPGLWTVSARPSLAGFTARAATVAAVAALLGAAPLPSTTAPAPAAERARLAPAVTAPEPAPAVRAAATSGVLEVDAENVVTGAEAEDVALEGVDESALEEAPGEAPAEEIAALTSRKGSAVRFQGLGVTWDADTDEDVLAVTVRLREGGEWTEWNELQIVGDRVQSSSTRTGTDPLLTDGADGYQVQVRTASGTAPSGLQVNLIDPGVGSLDDQVVDLAEEAAQTPVGTLSAARVDVANGRTVPAAVRASAVSDRLMPTIVRRSAWGADESSSYRAPQNARLSAMYIHHTASSNSYSREDAAAQIRAIHHYHADVLGWGDLGYHILVDRFGTIYEGARGSLDSLPRGGHAYGFNRDTFAVTALGDYSATAPSQAMVDAITRVIAWKSAAHGLDPAGRATLTSGGNTKYAAGTRVTGDAVMGHYYTNYTSCPGEQMIARLPSIRRAAAALIERAEGGTPSVPAPERLSTVDPLPATEPEPSAATYTVRPNDGWWLISHRTGVSAASLQRLNGMTARTVLHPGMVLATAPAATAPTPTPAPPASAGGTYTVRPDDGWWLISSRTGVSAAALQRLNGMTARTVLHPGMVLKTSSGTRSASTVRSATVDGAPLVNLRAGSSTSTTLLARIKRGTPVTITETAKSGSWAYVTHPTFEGWMSTAYLR